MYFTTKIANPKEAFNIISEAVQKFNTDSFINALQYNNFNEYTMSQMAIEISTYRGKLEKEYNNLVKFSQEFNKKFATSDNKYFDTSLKMLRVIKSGIRETKKIYMKFCPRAKREQFFYVMDQTPCTVYKYSYISADTYEGNLFKFDGFDPCVNSVYNEMTKFFVLLMKCIKLCKSVLADEKIIREDKNYCLFLFNELKKEVFPDVEFILDNIKLDNPKLTAEKNPAIASRLDCNDDLTWASQGFHRFVRDDVKYLIVREELLDREAHPEITDEERHLFQDNENGALLCREIILGFDKVLPAKCKYNKVPSKYYNWLMHFFGLDNPQNINVTLFLNYFNETYKSNPKHKFDTVTKQSISLCLAKSDGHKDIDNDPEYKKFKQKLTSLFHVIDPSKTQQVPHSA